MSQEVSTTIIEELEKAKNTEVEGYFLYKAAAEMITDEKGANIFAHLAKEELDHIRVITEIAGSVSGGKGWLSYSEGLAASSVSKSGEGIPIFSGESELLERLKENQTDMNAVKIGIESEVKAVEFYSALLARAGSPEEKVLLTELLEMEKAHLKILRWESESLSNTGFWCGNMEYSVEREID
jgi:rubrerythrin